MTIKKEKLTSSHDIHFDSIIEDLMKLAFNNVIQNRKSGRRLKGTGKYKKSSFQSGNSSVACVLQYIVFESTIRKAVKRLFNVDTHKRYKKNLWYWYTKLNSNAKKDDYIKSYFNEITLIRDIVTHAYLFDGFIKYDDKNYTIVGITEKVIGGKRKAEAQKRKTPKLKICISPNQIGFSDAAKFYQTTSILLKLAGLSFTNIYWNWEKTGEDLEPEKWLNNAMKYLKFSTMTEWKKLNELLDQADYIEYMKYFADIN